MNFESSQSSHCKSHRSHNQKQPRPDPMKMNSVLVGNCSESIPRPAANLAVFASLIIIILGTSLNFVTVLCLVSNSKLFSNPTTKFVINLTAADLVFCLISLPITLVRYATCSWPFGEFVCQLYPFLFYVNVAVSLLTITTITINR